MLYSVGRLAVLLFVLTVPSPIASFSVASATAASSHKSLHGAAATSPRASRLRLSSEPAATEDCGCADTADVGTVVPTASVGVMMNDVRVTGASLRATELADVNGARATIGSAVGEEGKAVIVFLRHLGWPLCWDYALNWQSQSGRLSRAGVAGPLFISVGRPDQLAQFLEVNPELKGAKALIDDSADFAGYRQAGFNYLMGDKALETPPDFKPPKSMGFGKWMSYLKNVGQLSPVPKEMKFGEVPPGVKVLGGTYAIDGEAVTFSHMDEVPGATPEIEDVLKAVGA